MVLWIAKLSFVIHEAMFCEIELYSRLRFRVRLAMKNTRQESYEIREQTFARG